MATTVTDKKAKLIEAFALGATWREAAETAGVGTSTIWRWMQGDSEFSAAIAEAKAGPDAEVEAVTYANCLDPDPAHNTLRMFWLKCRKPDVYQDRQSVNHSGGLSINHSYVEPGIPPTPLMPMADRPGGETV